MNKWIPRCAALVPCFNETEEIETVVREARQYLPNVIVVDDGSTDSTAGLATQAGAEVISLGGNFGKGAALKAGWRRARERGFSWVLMLDGDGQHAPGDIPLFLAAQERTGASLIVGSRMGNTEGMPQIRRWVNGWMSRRIANLVGSGAPDSQCGFRLADLEMLLALSLSSNRFEIESEMLVAFFATGCRVEFVPVQTIYKRGASKIHPVMDTWRWLRWRMAQPRTGTVKQSSSRASETSIHFPRLHEPVRSFK